MKRILFLVILVALVAPSLTACSSGCGGPPNMTWHWPLTFGTEQFTPTQTVQVPMAPTQTIQRVPIQYAPCAPAPAAAPAPVAYSSPPCK